jgi:hypothetical protein
VRGGRAALVVRLHVCTPTNRRRKKVRIYTVIVFTEKCKKEGVGFLDKIGYLRFMENRQ